MSIQEAYKHMLTGLSGIYEAREATAIAHWVMTALTGYSKTERLTKGDRPLSAPQLDTYTQYLEALLQHRPVQYVLGEAWFGPLKLYVDERVLIPRPETEELVEWIAEDYKGKAGIKLLDIGTGSGCIPLLLHRLLNNSEVHALDISRDALEVAKQNAATHKTSIQFHLIDILNEKASGSLPVFDCIVSNPPYIRMLEKADMFQNVLAYEPSRALFVPDNDPLLFYRAITAFAGKHLTNGGSLYFEINEALGKEMIALLEEMQFSEITLRKDLQEKDRMIRARFIAR
ncbi:peptide chain release factor N(5)-glutamine methyltransferase [Filimonas effusa]|uniref:Peptide chain release factor N(5)-glutamine methyltransferase n=1 Tax=Filimonas effusa TaxID=2508721 RepID=A0A4V1MAB1_9BACT|nr:peptide chain release factor N(5)-glutamine methyltransferase [Filimonas effusa]RXK85256.1 peptide chain release factor N(5)-glutamine methyltransferase [Filimonas effusa]